MFQIEDNISSGHPEGSTKLVFKQKIFVSNPMSSTDPKCMKINFQIEDIAKIIQMLDVQSFDPEFTQNSRKLDGATKPFSNETTKGEAEKTISNRRYS